MRRACAAACECNIIKHLKMRSWKMNKKWTAILLCCCLLAGGMQNVYAGEAGTDPAGAVSGAQEQSVPDDENAETVSQDTAASREDNAAADQADTDGRAEAGDAAADNTNPAGETAGQDAGEDAGTAGHAAGGDAAVSESSNAAEEASENAADPDMGNPEGTDAAPGNAAEAGEDGEEAVQEETVAVEEEEELEETVPMDANSAPVVQLFRFYNAVTKDHFYTISVAERDSLIKKYLAWDSEYHYEGVGWKVETAKTVTNTAVYRFYDAKNKDHFYTIDPAEKSQLQSKYSRNQTNYKYEGIGWYTPKAKNSTPLYRFYNSWVKDHFYTTSAAEKNQLIAKWNKDQTKYVYEGIAWYCAEGAPSSAAAAPKTVDRPVGITILNGVDYSAVYNFEYYVRNYPDIKKTYGSNPLGALKHFVNYGMEEGRQACAGFNVQGYRARYKDIRRLYGTDLPKFYLHYINSGKKEGRSGAAVSEAVIQAAEESDSAKILEDVYGLQDETAAYMLAATGFVDTGSGSVPKVKNPAVSQTLVNSFIYNYFWRTVHQDYSEFRIPGVGTGISQAQADQIAARAFGKGWKYTGGFREWRTFKNGYALRDGDGAPAFDVNFYSIELHGADVVAEASVIQMANIGERIYDPYQFTYRYSAAEDRYVISSMKSFSGTALVYADY